MRRSATFAILCLLLTGLVSAQLPRGSVKPGPWRTKSKIPDGWVVKRTRNYEIQSQCGEEKAERLGNHMEVMNKVYRRMFRPGKGGAKQQVIKLFKNRAAFSAYGAPANAAAYYSRNDREMVCYDTGKWSDEEKTDAPLTGKRDDDPLQRLRRRLAKNADFWKMDLLGCAAHEGWHQYFAWYTVSMASPLPSWINEGMGDYFYCAAPREVSGRKIPAQLGRTNDGRLRILKLAVARDRYYPPQKLINLSKNDYYTDGSVCYAHGWAFCQFLLHSGNKSYAKIIPTYIRLVRDTSNYEKVTERAFKRIDFEKMDAEFRAWIDAQPMPGVDEDENDEGDSGAGDSGAGNSGAGDFGAGD